MMLLFEMDGGVLMTRGFFYIVAFNFFIVLMMRLHDREKRKIALLGGVENALLRLESVPVSSKIQYLLSNKLDYLNNIFNISALILLVII
jgi:hypothetical protein